MKPPSDAPHYAGSIGRCPDHNKAWFMTRAQAKQFLKLRFPNSGMNVYECEFTDWFHVGHLLPAARRGLSTRDGRRWLNAGDSA